jgi:hypothetical protein
MSRWPIASFHRVTTESRFALAAGLRVEVQVGSPLRAESRDNVGGKRRQPQTKTQQLGIHGDFPTRSTAMPQQILIQDNISTSLTWDGRGREGVVVERMEIRRGPTP